MTPQRPEPLRPPSAGGEHPGADALADYAVGSVDRVTAWSVEAHLAGCAGCRWAVSGHVEPARLARNRDVLLVRVALTGRNPVRRVLARCGVPEHVSRLLAATPSLRPSWFASLLGVLAVLTGEAALAAHLSAGARPGLADGRVLLPFVLVTPLLVLAAVSGAYLPPLDPAYRLAVAAPFSGVTLLLVRALCALVAALVPVTLAASLLPGPGWLAAALLLPSLAVCAVALAAAALVGPRMATGIAAAAWAVPVVWLASARSPLSVLRWHEQQACAVVFVVAVAVLLARRDRYETGSRS